MRSRRLPLVFGVRLPGEGRMVLDAPVPAYPPREATARGAVAPGLGAAGSTHPWEQPPLERAEGSSGGRPFCRGERREPGLSGRCDQREHPARLRQPKTWLAPAVPPGPSGPLRLTTGWGVDRTRWGHGASRSPAGCRKDRGRRLARPPDAGDLRRPRARPPRAGNPPSGSPPPLLAQTGIWGDITPRFDCLAPAAYVWPPPPAQRFQVKREVATGGHGLGVSADQCRADAEERAQDSGGVYAGGMGASGLGLRRRRNLDQRPPSTLHSAGRPLVSNWRRGGRAQSARRALESR